jgi:hypothetical protein
MSIPLMASFLRSWARTVRGYPFGIAIMLAFCRFRGVFGVKIQNYENEIEDLHSAHFLSQKQYTYLA